jgi:hypothetical protein
VEIKNIPIGYLSELKCCFVAAAIIIK